MCKSVAMFSQMFVCGRALDIHTTRTFAFRFASHRIGADAGTGVDVNGGISADGSGGFCIGVLLKSVQFQPHRC